MVFIGSDLGAGVLDAFRDDLPERFFMEGISEQAIIGMAAGLAMEGYVPFVNTLATFLTRRCYEQIAIDLCLQKLPVRLLGYGGGVVYAPLGPTHLAVDDIGLLRLLPNMTIFAPCDAEEIDRAIALSADVDGPMYIRLGQGDDEIVSRESDAFAFGNAVAMRPGREALLVTTGVMTQVALHAAERLAVQGMEVGVMHVHTIKPLDRAALVAQARRVPLVFTVEEHLLAGGFGSAVLEVLSDDLGPAMPVVVRAGLTDAFPGGYGDQTAALRRVGLDEQSIADRVLAAVRALR
ncbi:transketolase C-terminal domain-containing protein [Asanoa sp. NPDC049518]|uniref:transketolase family protein n=1 Tax=unclassified Asanoa TaxID=2685164 RepID=UPI0034249A92